MSIPKKALGKGLGALISSAEKDASQEQSRSGVIEMDINKIEPNKDQPRKYFDDQSLHELADSLKQFGVIQPILVKEEEGYYGIIAGERRWRAARMANIATVPIIIKDYNKQDILQIALIENIQRQDLNPIEEALCYKRLMDEFFLTQETMATQVGKSRNSISYAVGLLVLDPRVQNFLIEGKLTAGHGRFLLQIKDNDHQFELAEHIIDEEASVRETEKMVKEWLGAQLSPPLPVPLAPASTANPFKHVETDLQQILGTKVSIRSGKSKGKIEIEYYSPDELERLIGLFKQMD